MIHLLVLSTISLLTGLFLVVYPHYNSSLHLIGLALATGGLCGLLVVIIQTHPHIELEVFNATP